MKIRAMRLASAALAVLLGAGCAPQPRAATVAVPASADTVAVGDHVVITTDASKLYRMRVTGMDSHAIHGRGGGKAYRIARAAIRSVEIETRVEVDPEPARATAAGITVAGLAVAAVASVAVGAMFVDGLERFGETLGCMFSFGMNCPKDGD
jgi:hypothetical protein